MSVVCLCTVQSSVHQTQQPHQQPERPRLDYSVVCVWAAIYNFFENRTHRKLDERIGGDGLRFVGFFVCAALWADNRC